MCSAKDVEYKRAHIYEIKEAGKVNLWWIKSEEKSYIRGKGIDTKGAWGKFLSDRNIL